MPLGENCSVPSARMAYLLAGLVGEGDSILEIGTGSGYQTAILAERFKYVVSMEACPILGVAEKLPNNVALLYGMDGTSYFNLGEQFAAILVTFAVPSVFEVWVDHLKLGGTLVAPIQVGQSCRISVYKKTDEDTLLLDDVVAYAPFTHAVSVN